MGLFNLMRLGSLFGQPPSAMSDFPALELGTGTAVVAQLTTTVLDSAIVPEDNVIFPGFPTQRDEINLEMFSDDSTAGPFAGSAAFAIRKNPAVVDEFFYQMITFNGAGTRTFDWAWYSVPT